MRIPRLLLLVVAVAVAGPCVGQELLPNAGFEEAIEGGRFPARWQARTITLGAHRLVPDARAGERAAQIEFTEGEGNQVSGYYYSDPQPLPACKRVTVSAWVKVTSGGPGESSTGLVCCVACRSAP